MIPAAIRKLSYFPAVRFVVRATGLQKLAQQLYRQHALPQDGILHLSYADCEAKFSCPTVTELRGIELFSTGSDEEFKRVLGFLRSDEVFFDVGAQYGAYGLLVANSHASNVRVVAFEPFPTEYALLEKNIALNGSTNVQALNVALSDHDGQVAMSNGGAGGKFCPRVGPPVAGCREVRSSRADTLIKTGQVPFPNVLKLDVEGHELAVLRGMAETLGDPRCHGIYCEIHDSLLPTGDTVGDLLALLRSKGFNSISEEPGSNHRIFAEKL